MNYFYGDSDDILYQVMAQDEEEEEEFLSILLMFPTMMPSILGGQRNSYHVRERLNWLAHVHKLHQEGTQCFFFYV